MKLSPRSVRELNNTLSSQVLGDGLGSGLSQSRTLRRKWCNAADVLFSRILFSSEVAGDCAAKIRCQLPQQVCLICDKVSHKLLLGFGFRSAIWTLAVISACRTVAGDCAAKIASKAGQQVCRNLLGFGFRFAGRTVAFVATATTPLLLVSSINI